MYSMRFTSPPHFQWICDVFLSIWWSIMITLYLNFMFPSIFWWKNIKFDKKWGWKVNLAEYIWTKKLVHICCVRFAFKPHFLWKCDVFSINLMVNYDQTVPKPYAYINILMKKTSNLTKSGVETWISQSTHGPKYWSIFAVWDLPLNLIFCDNVMFFINL